MTGKKIEIFNMVGEIEGDFVRYADYCKDLEEIEKVKENRGLFIDWVSEHCPEIIKEYVSRE